MQSQRGPLSRGDLVERDITLLKPHARNARTHSKKQIDQIARSIQKFGFTNPILIDEQDRIIAGHGRVEAAKSLGLTQVPVLLLDGMSEADRRAYIIADNRLAELAGWDRELLGLELGDLSAMVPDFDFDVIGFDVAEIEALLNGVDEKEVVEDTAEEPEQKASPVTRPGDMWQLGGHRLICGDSTKGEVFEKLMGDELAQMVFTDAPYNVPVNGHICGLGKVQHDEFIMGAGEMSRAEFTDFLARVMDNLAAYSVDGSIHYQCMDWRHMGEMLEAGERVYDSLRNLVVWNKDNGGMGTFYRSKHELIFVFRKGSAAHINNFELGQHGRYRTNVWDYAGVNSLKADRNEELAMHPTVKPVKMVADAMLDCSRHGGIVLDAFSGSGTTIIAAEQTGRLGRAVEMDPRYVDVAVRRWQKLTGQKAILCGSDLSFDEIETVVNEVDI
ncbi:methyltransferase [Sphingobium sp. TA15]|uniref:Methyltransferase n=1 Tax=Sphingobium indicum (strain DSM 16413 / CCM 7287 / MTCC 6362 / UT26 / NBRC 101211 / UT26S) TaxID=452662 RepID=D4Z4B1_SPHIU|nr:DNA methyltransferase [Sphingobium indicum]BAI97443.1 putative DNA modification methylase [Sphingobium indicum UT26S]BDD66859.1 methyltransferase [Sphingobium sp. TA15]